MDCIRTYYVLHYVVSGKGYLTLKGKQYEITAGDLFLIPPKEENCYYPDKTDPWNYYWIGFSGMIARQTVQAIGFKDCCVLHLGLLPDLIKLFRACSNSYSENKFFDFTILGHLYHILAKIGNETSEHNIPNSSITASYVHNAIRYIQQHYSEPIRIMDIAYNLGLNANYFSGIFTKIIGIPPQKYIIEYKINKSCELLATKKYSITTVAAMVGYSNPLHFSKEFKNIKGISPKFFDTTPFTSTD